MDEDSSDNAADLESRSLKIPEFLRYIFHELESKTPKNSLQEFWRCIFHDFGYQKLPVIQLNCNNGVGQHPVIS